MQYVATKRLSFLDVEISATFSDLKDRLNEFYHIELERQKKLAEIQATTIQNETFIYKL